MANADEAFAVIFRAKIKQFDEQYAATARQLRERALTEFGCLEFVSCCEGEQEIAISYWPSLAHIQRWKQDLAHQQAQAKGRADWYSSYQVEIVELKRRYGSPGTGSN